VANLTPVSTTTAVNFATETACVVDTGPVSTIAVVNLPKKGNNIRLPTPSSELYYSKRCPNKIIKTFIISDFFHFWCGVNDTSAYFQKKFETALMGYSGAGGKMIHEKKLKSKILWHCPFQPISLG
jgi:hypothetical protein